MLTLAIVSVLSQYANQATDLTGGDNGLQGIRLAVSAKLAIPSVCQILLAACAHWASAALHYHSTAALYPIRSLLHSLSSLAASRRQIFGPRIARCTGTGATPYPQAG
jgi:ABC-type branched-subunit amino acid transport system permease subunit